MADEADLANDQAERFLSQALANHRSNTPRLAPRGRCYYCEAEFDETDPAGNKKLFCDSDCAKDYEHEQRLKARR